jgi:hypothetical protein
MSCDGVGLGVANWVGEIGALGGVGEFRWAWGSRIERFLRFLRLSLAIVHKSPSVWVRIELLGSACGRRGFRDSFY